MSPNTRNQRTARRTRPPAATRMRILHDVHTCAHPAHEPDGTISGKRDRRCRAASAKGRPVRAAGNASLAQPEVCWCESLELRIAIDGIEARRAGIELRVR